MNLQTTLIMLMLFTICDTRSVYESEPKDSRKYVDDMIKEYYDDRFIRSPSQYYQTSVEYSEKSDDKYKTEIHQRISELEHLPVFNRTLRFRQKSDEFEFDSYQTDPQYGNATFFKFKTEFDDGIKLKYETRNNNTNGTEEISIHFREFIVNNTVYDLQEMDMNAECVNNVCIIRPYNQLFNVVIEFSSNIFNINFNNTIRKIFPTDIKFSVNLNTSENTNYTFVVKIDNNEDNVNNTDDDNGYYFSHNNNSHTYTSFDRYALCDNNTIPVYLNQNDDNFEFTFTVTNGSNVYWDPMIGGTFDQLNISMESYLPTYSGSSASIINASMFFLVSLVLAQYF